MGTPVGKIKKIRLNDSLNGVTADAFIYKTYSHLAEKECSFNIVRPQIGINGISGMDTLITGPYIEIIPSESVIAKTDGNITPEKSEKNDPVLLITLFSERVGSVSEGAPVYYRQIKVGEVVSHTLTNTSDKIRFNIQIEKKYAPLVRKNSKFWNTSGIDFKIKPFQISVETESLLSLMSGGISFATPDNDKMGAQAKPFETFTLHDKPKRKWLKWKPEIPLDE